MELIISIISLIIIFGIIYYYFIYNKTSTDGFDNTDKCKQNFGCKYVDVEIKRATLNKADNSTYNSSYNTLQSIAKSYCNSKDNNEINCGIWNMTKPSDMPQYIQNQDDLDKFANYYNKNCNGTLKNVRFNDDVDKKILNTNVIECNLYNNILCKILLDAYYRATDQHDKITQSIGDFIDSLNMDDNVRQNITSKIINYFKDNNSIKSKADLDNLKQKILELSCNTSIKDDDMEQKCNVNNIFSSQCLTKIQDYKETYNKILCSSLKNEINEAAGKTTGDIDLESYNLCPSDLANIFNDMYIESKSLNINNIENKDDMNKFINYWNEKCSTSDDTKLSETDYSVVAPTKKTEYSDIKKCGSYFV